MNNLTLSQKYVKACAHCGNLFTKRDGELTGGFNRRSTCSKECGFAFRGPTRHLDLTPESFWSRVDVRGSDECWPWTRSLNNKGYGKVVWKIGDKVDRFATHRIAYYLTNGVIVGRAEGLLIRHKCDNPPCCNPSHLEIGTPADNTRDMVERGRSPKGPNMPGELHPQAKLTEADVREIRRRHASGDRRKDIASDYGIARIHVNSIVARRSWKNVA